MLKTCVSEFAIPLLFSVTFYTLYPCSSPKSIPQTASTPSPKDKRYSKADLRASTGDLTSTTVLLEDDDPPNGATSSCKQQQPSPSTAAPPHSSNPPTTTVPPPAVPSTTTNSSPFAVNAFLSPRSRKSPGESDPPEPT